MKSQNGIDVLKDHDWYDRPDRICAGDERYADLLLEPSRRERERMALACLRCPVYYECLADALRFPIGERYGIRAGIIGRA